MCIYLQPVKEYCVVRFNTAFGNLDILQRDDLRSWIDIVKDFNGTLLAISDQVRTYNDSHVKIPR